MNNTNNHHTPRQPIQAAKELTSELLFQETLLGSFIYYLCLIIFVLGLVTILFLSGFIITIIVLIILWCTCLTYLFYFNYGEPSSLQDLPLDIKQILRFISVFMSTIYKLPSYAPLIIPYLSSSLNYRNSKDDNLFKDIKYNKFNNLDIYSTVKPLPNKLSAVIVFVYGGAWSSGDKSIYQLIGRKYQNMGYTVVILNYSWYPKGTIELMISNINDGINWVRNNIHNFGGDPEQITLIGHSAGAHLCLSVHLLKVISRLDFDQLEQNPEVQASGMKLSALSNLKSVNLWLKKDFKKFQTILEDSDEVETIKLEKIILISGVYNIQNHFSFEAYRGIEFLSAMARAMGNRNSTRSRIRASPSAWLTWLGDLELMSEVTETLPNKGLTLLHGELDATVPYSSSELLFYQLKRLMSITDQEHLLQFYLTPEMDHTDPNFGLMLNNHKFSPLMEELLPSKL